MHPVRLYKYLSDERIDALAGLSLRFTQAADFNDPFEVVPNIGAITPVAQQAALLQELEPEVPAMYEEALDRELAKVGTTLGELDKLLASRGIKAKAKDLLTPRDIAKQATSLMARVLPLMPNAIRPTFGRDFQARFGERFGILSLSATPTSLLMWAHYAASHRGYLIELNGDHAFFNDPSARGAIGKLFPVSYRQNRPEVTVYDTSLLPDQFMSTMVRDVLLTKSVEWAYEEEYRMILPLGDMSRTHHVVGGRFHLFAIPADAIKGVVFGARILEQTREKLLAVVKESPALSHVSVQQARTSDSQFEVVIERN